jgi:hypothetical protein
MFSRNEVTAKGAFYRNKRKATRGNKVQCMFSRLWKYWKQTVVTGSGGLSCTDRQAILEAHNKARQSVALGRVPGQPAASKMLEMVSDTGGGGEQGNERVETNKLSRG